MMRQILTLLLLTCAATIFATDSITLVNYSFRDNVSQYGVWGFELKAEFSGSYSNNDDSSSLIHIMLYKDNQPVKANHGYSMFGNSDGNMDFSLAFTGKHITFFIPYYSMNLSPGSHNLSAKFSAYLKVLGQGTFYEKYRDVPGKAVITILQPELLKIKARVNEIRVADLDRKGRYWDVDGSPDLRFKVYMSSNWNGEKIYAFSKVKNAFSASWLDFSDVIYLTKKDGFCIYIVDADTAFDDTIGYYYFTYDSFIAAVNSGKIKPDGQLTHLVMSYELVP